MPLVNKWRFFLGALRRGKWDLGYWKKYDPANDIDYIFTKMADHISAPTDQMKNWAIKNWQLQPEQVKVIGNPFVANDHFTGAITDNSQKAVIFYGRLNILKGLFTATQAMKVILKRNPDWKWIIVGDDGPAMDGKLSMREWMNLQLKDIHQQVYFYDGVQHNELGSFLKQASIVLIPSLFESYSYVTIEAMSAGKAIVGSTNTGISSLVEDNKTGLLADPYNVNQWEQAIQRLINDEGLRKDLGSNAVEYTHHKNKVNQKIPVYYQNILSLKK